MAFWRTVRYASLGWFVAFSLTVFVSFVLAVVSTPDEDGFVLWVIFVAGILGAIYIGPIGIVAGVLIANRGRMREQVRPPHRRVVDEGPTSPTPLG